MARARTPQTRTRETDMTDEGLGRSYPGYVSSSCPQRIAAASHINHFHVSPPEQRHDFGNEYAQFAWDTDQWLAAPPIAAYSLYTLVNLQASAKTRLSLALGVQGTVPEGGGVRFDIRRRRVGQLHTDATGRPSCDGALYHDESRGARPQTAATRVECGTLDRANALSEVPVGTSYSHLE